MSSATVSALRHHEYVRQRRALVTECNQIYAGHVEVRLDDPSGVLRALHLGPFCIEHVGEGCLTASCNYGDVLCGRWPRIDVQVNGCSLRGRFQMWPAGQSAVLAEPQLSAAHQFQIACLDRQLGRGPSAVRLWLRRELQRLALRCLAPVLSRAQLAVRHWCIELQCPHEWDQQAPPQRPSEPMPLASCSLKLTLDAVVVSRSCASEQRTITKDAASEVAGELITAVSLAGLTIECSPHSESAHGNESSYVVRRWGARAMMLAQQPPQATPGPELDLAVDLRPNAMVLHMNATVLHTVRTFSSAMRAWSAFQLYRAVRPRLPVAQDVRAWWRHAGACVLRHVREAKVDAPLPVSCLRKLPAMLRLYAAPSAAGALWVPMMMPLSISGVTSSPSRSRAPRLHSTVWCAGERQLLQLDASLTPRESKALRLLAWALTRTRRRVWAVRRVRRAMLEAQTLPSSVCLSDCQRRLQLRFNLRCPRVAVVLQCLSRRSIVLAAAGLDSQCHAQLWAHPLGQIAGSLEAGASMDTLMVRLAHARHACALSIRRISGVRSGVHHLRALW